MYSWRLLVVIKRAPFWFQSKSCTKNVVKSKECQPRAFGFLWINTGNQKKVPVKNVQSFIYSYLYQIFRTLGQLVLHFLISFSSHAFASFCLAFQQSWCLLAPRQSEWEQIQTINQKKESDHQNTEFSKVKSLQKKRVLDAQHIRFFQAQAAVALHRDCTWM